MGKPERSKAKSFDLVLFTIGHSNHTSEHFLELLRNHNIVCVVDVRSVPFNKYSQHFAKDSLSSELPRNGIEYIWMGDNLGGRRDDLQTSLRMRRNDKYDENPGYHRGVIELMRKALSKPTVVMCSEEDPRKCHRHKIIAQTLLHRRLPECHKLDSTKVVHIRGDGGTEDARSIPVSFQLSLFE